MNNIENSNVIMPEIEEENYELSEELISKTIENLTEEEIKEIDNIPMYIYKITNLINNKIYIGQTYSIRERWYRYRSSVKREVDSSMMIVRSMIKHGIENFKIEEIEKCKNRNESNIREKYYIELYDARNTNVGYNIALGGDSQWQSAEIIAKIQEGRKKYFELHGNPRKGVPLSEEHKKAISIASMGKPGTNLGRVFSQEWKDKLSDSNSGRVATEEQRKNCSESHMGQVAWNRKLDFDKAEEIRKARFDDGKTLKWIKDNYGIASGTISTILNQNSYKSKIVDGVIIYSAYSIPKQSAAGKAISEAMKGRKSANAKLTQEQADEIRILRSEKKLSYIKLGEIYGVNKQLICQICNNQTYVKNK
jgi:group I intron endonuclease